MGNRSYDAPDISRELLPVVLDRVARQSPEAIFVTVASGNGNNTITFRQYANAVSGVAWFLENKIGKGHNDEGLAYFGTGGGDIYYAILFIAAVKVGYYVSV